MIYLHCGWPKTGTSSLQAAFVRSEERLAAAGLIYPRKWRREVDGSHNDLGGLLLAFSRTDASLDEVGEHLEAYADSDIVLSSESLILWTMWDERHEAFLALLDKMQEIAPVRCIWTLRRLDEMIRSLYIQLTLSRFRTPGVAELNGFPVEALLVNMQTLGEAAAGGVQYVKYEPTGDHQDELLCALGLPSELVHAIGRELRDRPRLNASLSHKQVAAVADIDALSARAGIALDSDRLIAAFREGFGFEEDWPCTPLEHDVLAGMHERALESARRVGFDPYVRFFADAPVERSPFPAGLHAGVLGADDLDRLRAYMGPRERLSATP